MPILKPGEIHLWCCRSDPAPDPVLLKPYEDALSADEKHKIKRYRFAEDRLNSLLSRALTRWACSTYLQDKPLNSWSFTIDAKGKPRLTKQADRLFFNLSHTQGMVILALSCDAELGADVEYVQRQSDTQSIAQRYFSDLECAALATLPEAQQAHHFFDYWTLKESYIKACGQGLAIPLDSFSFDIDRGAAPQDGIQRAIRLQFHKGREDNPAAWQSFLFDLSPVHRAAVSIRCDAQAKPFKLLCFDCSSLRAIHAFQPPLNAS